MLKLTSTYILQTSYQVYTHRDVRAHV